MYVVSRCCCFDSSNDPTNSLPCLDAPVTWRVFKLEELEELGECGAFLLFVVAEKFFFFCCVGVFVPSDNFKFFCGKICCTYSTTNTGCTHTHVTNNNSRRTHTGNR
jgi:hypothetical protein